MPQCCLEKSTIASSENITITDKKDNNPQDRISIRLQRRMIQGFYALSLEEVEEAYWFGSVRPCVHACVRPCITLCMLSRTIRDRILKFDMWNKYEK